MSKTSLPLLVLSGACAALLTSSCGDVGTSFGGGAAPTDAQANTDGSSTSGLEGGANGGTNGGGGGASNGGAAGATSGGGGGALPDGGGASPGDGGPATTDACVTGAPEICGDGLDNDCDGTPDDGCGGIGTFVSAKAGDDGNAGTRAAPLRTIAKALANAQTIGGGADVYVADGTYAEDLDLVEGTSVFGGYACASLPCSWSRNVSTCGTLLKPPSAEGVHAGPTITRATAIDGLRIDGAAGGNSSRFGRAALTIEGGSPTVTDDCIYGPDSSGTDYKLGRTHGIAIIAPTADPAGALIENDRIFGGDHSQGQSTSAISFDWAIPGKTVAEVRKNVITGGQTSGGAAGIAHWSATTGTLVEDNDIGGGKATGAGNAFAIRGGGTVVIRNNRINADAKNPTACEVSGTNASGLLIWCGGIDSESSTSTIENNVVYGASAPNSAAVRLGEFETPAGAVILNGNTLYGPAPNGGTLAPTNSAAIVLTIGTCTGCGFKAQVGKIRNDILVAEHGANRYGVYEDAPPGRTQKPSALQNDLFYIPGLAGNDALYRAYDGSNASLLTTIGAVNGITIPGGLVGSDISGDPKLDATSHLGAQSPALNAGTATEAPADDMDGDKRPRGTAVDIGADEAG